MTVRRISGAACAAITAAAIFAASPAAAAPVAPDRNATARLRVHVPLTLTRLSDLHFGTLLPSGQGGAAFINAYTGQRMVTGGVTGMAGDTGNRARFVCSGSPNQDIAIQLGAPPTLTNASGASMPILSLTLDGGSTRRIGSSGQVAFAVGGALMVNADQPDGDYAAEITVTVDYL